MVVRHMQERAALWGKRGAAGIAAIALALGGGLTTVIAADFNSPPTALRSRRLGRAGFARARGLWPPQGTFPAWAPRPLSLAIDGLAVGRGVSVRSWRAVAAPGSDHRAALIEIVIQDQ